MSRPFFRVLALSLLLWGMKFVCLVLQEGLPPAETPMKYTNVDSWKEFLQALGLDRGASVSSVPVFSL